MMTTTVGDLEKLQVAIDQVPAIAACVRAVADAGQVVSQVQQRVEHLRGRQWEAAARLALPEAEAALDRADVQLREAVRRRDAAREVERDRRRHELVSLLKTRVKAFKAALLDARMKNDAVKQVQQIQHELLGDPLDSLAWWEFGERLNHWLEAVRNYELLDE
jgi:hypothetical protein